MIYAPIVIPTLNRIEHLRNCIESLQRNKYAEETEVFIGLDYPPSEKYEDGYKRVKEYLEGDIKGFKRVTVLYRDHNFGAVANGDALIEFVWKNYDRCIFSEDDNVFSPCFLEYMNKALDVYSDREDILAVYSHTPHVKAKDTISNKAYIVNYFSAYGYGAWREKEQKLNCSLNRSYIENLSCDKKKLRLLKKKLPESICYLASILLRKESIYQTPDGRVELIDTVRITHAIAENKFLLCSPIPMVKNMGYDGSGAHCSTDKTKFANIDLSVEFDNPVIFEDEPEIENLDYRLRLNRYIPYISAWVRIWLWRIIAKRKSF